MNLTRKQKRQLTLQGTRLNPIILIGNKGYTEAVDLEIERGLNDHGLIKIRFHSKDRDNLKETAKVICERHEAALISQIGHVIVIYRPQQDDQSG